MRTRFSLATALVVMLPAVLAAQQTTPPPATTPPPQATQDAASAQGRGAGGAPQPPAVTDQAKLATVQDLLDGMEISNADKALQIDDQHYAVFIQRLRNLQRLRRQHQMLHQRLVGELRRLANQQPPAEDALLEAPTKRLDDFDKQAFQEIQTAYAQIDEVLNVRQRARFRLFEENMEQRKLEILTRVLKSGAPEPGRGGK